MKIRIVSHRDKIPTIAPDEIIVHMTFRPKNVDFLNIVKACPKIEAVQVPPAYIGSVSMSSRMFLEMQRIQLIEGVVWGHRTDICNSYTIPDSLTSRIHEMRVFGISSEVIGETIQREFRMDAGTVGFVVSKN